jgi:outer membrane protein TolC
MVSCKPRTQRLVTGSLIPTCLLILAAAFFAGTAPVAPPAQAAEGSREKPAASSERLRQLLTQRYEILKGIVESLQPYFEAGRIDVAELRDATVAMHRARADLCTTAAERAKVYETLVGLLRTYEEYTARRAAAGRATEAEVDRAKVATLEAQIELERQKLAM